MKLNISSIYLVAKNKQIPKMDVNIFNHEIKINYNNSNPILNY